MDPQQANPSSTSAASPPSALLSYPSRIVTGQTSVDAQASTAPVAEQTRPVADQMVSVTDPEHIEKDDADVAALPIHPANTPVSSEVSVSSASQIPIWVMIAELQKLARPGIVDDPIQDENREQVSLQRYRDDHVPDYVEDMLRQSQGVPTEIREAGAILCGMQGQTITSRLQGKDDEDDEDDEDEEEEEVPTYTLSCHGKHARHISADSPVWDMIRGRGRHTFKSDRPGWNESVSAPASVKRRREVEEDQLQSGPPAAKKPRHRSNSPERVRFDEVVEHSYEGGDFCKSAEAHKREVAEGRAAARVLMAMTGQAQEDPDERDIDEGDADKEAAEDTEDDGEVIEDKQPKKETVRFRMQGNKWVRVPYSKTKAMQAKASKGEKGGPLIQRWKLSSV